jgi:hypothetical protein
MVCPFLDRMAVVAVPIGNEMHEVEDLPGGELVVHGARAPRTKKYFFPSENRCIDLRQNRNYCAA